MAERDFKREAAAAALKLIEPGMRVGLGTGSTAAKLVDLLGKQAREGFDVVCVPTSEATRAQAEAAGIKLSTLDETPFLDLTIDGADEIDPELRLIKGGGGALLREKIVAGTSDRLIIIADESKLVKMLGAFALPIEVVQFGLKSTQALIEALAQDAGAQGKITRRMAGGKPFVTDSGHAILDCAFGQIPDPEVLDMALKLVPGVVENGLFIGLADLAIIAGPKGISVLEATVAEETE